MQVILINYDFLFIQYTSGADLGILFIDVLNKSETETSKVYFEKITNLFSIMKQGTPERETFLHNALRWSLKHSHYKWGHPDLHKLIAESFWHGENSNPLYYFGYPIIAEIDRRNDFISVFITDNNTHRFMKLYFRSV